MKVCARGFNLFLALAATVTMLCGCQTDKKPKEAGALRVHIETNPGPEGTSQNISVLRSDPMVVTIAPDPILTEANLIAAKIIESPGGYAVEVKFDELSASALEQYTASNPGRHLVIFGQWGEKPDEGRWLAAPLITHRISDGLIAFTPDASREEVNHLVTGLTNVIAQTHKADLK